jgi:hypothetical protein
MGTDTAVTFVRGPYNASANLDAAASQQLIGTWSGTVNNTELVFEFSEANGSVSGSLSIPAMGAQGLGLSELAGNSDAMSFSVRGIQATFAGSLDGDSLSGEWSRAGSTNPLNLSRN